MTFVEKLRETVTFKVWEFHVEGPHIYNESEN